MRTVRLTGIRRLEISDIPEPQVKNRTDVLLRVEAVGLCGSDLHYYLKGGIGDQVISYPFTVGHECTARVEAAGPGCSGVHPGDRVVVDPAVSCGTCDQCLSRRRHTCRNLRFLGCPGQMEGCLSEFLVMPEENCYPVTDDMTPARGVLVEPLSIGLYSLKLLKDMPVRSIGILGSGPIGLSTALAARAGGIAGIYMTDKIDDRLEAAQTAGAVWVGNPEKTDIVQDLAEIERDGLDAVFECCGDQDALDQAVSLLKPGGKLMIIGIPETDRITFDAHLIRRKEISVQNVRRQNRCVEEAIHLILDSQVSVDFMATHTFSVDKAKKAFDLVADYADGVLKAIIDIKG